METPFCSLALILFVKDNNADFTFQVLKEVKRVFFGMEKSSHVVPLYQIIYQIFFTEMAYLLIWCSYLHISNIVPG